MKFLEVKLDYRQVSPYGLFDNEIRRKYYLFGLCLLKTDWFKLSKLWPGMTATIKELQNAGCKGVTQQLIDK